MFKALTRAEVPQILSRQLGLQAVRGMSDRLEEDTAKYRRVVQHAQRILENRGYREIMPNMIEEQEVFLKSLGEDSDIVSKEMYFVTTSSGDRKYVLRPEMTAGVGRIALQENWATALPKRVWYHGPMFRHERPQKGRLRQFHQVGIEHFGAKDGTGDVEVLLAGIELLQALGDNKLSFEVQVNSIGDSKSRQTFSKDLQGWLRKPDIFSKLSEEDKRRTETNPFRVLDSKSFEKTDLAAQAPQIRDYLTQESTRTFDYIVSILKGLPINFKINPSLVRGLEYYNDFCFEVKPSALPRNRNLEANKVPKESHLQDLVAGASNLRPSASTNKQATLLAGGRYDSLLGDLSKDKRRNIKAVGFGMGIERMLNFLDESGVIDQTKVHHGSQAVLLVMSSSEGELPDSKIYRLRDWLARELDCSLVIKQCRYQDVGKKLAKLGNQGYNSALIYGEAEKAASKIICRNLDTRTESTIELPSNI